MYIEFPIGISSSRFRPITHSCSRLGSQIHQQEGFPIPKLEKVGAFLPKRLYSYRVFDAALPGFEPTVKPGTLSGGCLHHTQCYTAGHIEDHFQQEQFSLEPPKDADFGVILFGDGNYMILAGKAAINDNLARIIERVAEREHSPPALEKIKREATPKQVRDAHFSRMLGRARDRLWKLDHPIKMLLYKIHDALAELDLCIVHGTGNRAVSISSRQARLLKNEKYKFSNPVMEVTCYGSNRRKRSTC